MTAGRPYARKRLIALLGGAAIAVVLWQVASFLSAPAERPPARSAEPPAAAEAGDALEAGPPVVDLAAGPAAPQQLAGGVPVDTGSWKGSKADVPMLMYHDVEAPPADAPFPDLHVDSEDFERQMAWLAERGYTAVTVDQLTAAWYGEGVLPERPVVVTFDDGFASHFEVARPVLAEHGWPGVLMLQMFSGKGMPEGGALSEQQVEKLIAGGWEIDSHTITHADLTTVSADQLESEVAQSRKALREQFGVPANHLCFPAGKYDDTVIAAVEKAGYTTSSTVEPGLASADEPYALERIRVNGSDGLDGFVESMKAVGA